MDDASGRREGDPCDRLTVTAADGATVTACAHGGQVLGWTPATGGPDRLWTSPLARCGPGEAIRGGIPVVFPQFSNRPLPGAPGAAALPKHGLARDRAWQVLDAGDPDARPTVARIRLGLRSDDATRALWPHAFTLTLEAAACGQDLDVTLDVYNEGPEPFAFAAALHTYLRVDDAAVAVVTGLDGLTAQRNDDLTEHPLPAGPLVALGPRDVALPAAVEQLSRRGQAAVVGDPVLGDVRIGATGLPDLVLWNPGTDHGLADVPQGGASSFVCLEPALLTPLTLAPHESWRGTQRLTALVPLR